MQKRSWHVVLNTAGRIVDEIGQTFDHGGEDAARILNECPYRIRSHEPYRPAVLVELPRDELYQQYLKAHAFLYDGGDNFEAGLMVAITTILELLGLLPEFRERMERDTK